ncbi:MAG: hypothetical protein ABII64_04380 [Elusimicrobiota bacterium]
MPTIEPDRPNYKNIIANFCTFLGEITNQTILLDLYLNIATKPAFKRRKFPSAYFSAKSKVKSTSQSLIKLLDSKKYPINFPDQKSAEILVWYILLLPLPIARNSGLFAKIRLKGILPAYREIFYRLILEYHVSPTGLKEALNHEARVALLDFLNICVEDIEDILHPTISYTNQAYDLYLNTALNTPISNRFLVVASAYFNFKIYQDLRREYCGATGDTSELEDEQDETIEDSKKSRKRKARWLDTFPLNMDVMAVPIKNMRDVLLQLEYMDIDTEELHPITLWETIVKVSQASGNIPSSISRKYSDFYKFRTAALKFRTIWAYDDRSFIRDAFELADIQDSNSSVAFELAALSEDCKDVQFLDNKFFRELEHSMGLKNTDIWALYCTKLMAENILFRYQSEGLTGLRFTTDSPRYIRWDRLCALIGHITNTARIKIDDRELILNKPIKRILCLAIIESYLTGADIYRIFGLKLERTSEKVQPIGLFVDPSARIREEDELYLNDTGPSFRWDILKKYFDNVLWSFNKKYPDFKLTASELSYSGKANLVEIGMLSPIEASHCAGVSFSGVKSSMHYLRPINLPERLLNTQGKLLDDALDILKSSKLKGNFKEINRLMSDSKQYFIEYKSKLNKHMHLLRQRIQYELPKIFKIDTLGLRGVFDDLVKLIETSDGNDRTVHIQGLGMFMLQLDQCLRPKESEPINGFQVSFRSNTLIVYGKIDQHHSAQLRPVPLSSGFAEFIKVLMKKAGIGYREDKLFTNPLFPDYKKATKILNELFASRCMGSEPYDCRKYSATTLHYLYDEKYTDEARIFNRQYGVQGLFYEVWAAIMGHGQRGYEIFGSNSFINYGYLRKCVEEYHSTEAINTMLTDATTLLESL